MERRHVLMLTLERDHVDPRKPCRRLLRIKGYVFDDTESKVATARLQRRNKELESAVADRTKVLQEKQENLQAIPIYAAFPDEFVELRYFSSGSCNSLFELGKKPIAKQTSIDIQNSQNSGREKW